MRDGGTKTGRQGIAPASRWLIEAGIAWALLALLVLCVDPGYLARPVALLLVCGPLCGCLASPALLWAMWRDPRHLWWYRRWSYVGAGSISSVFVLRGLHVITMPRLLLCCLILAVALLLRRWSQRTPAVPAPAQPDGALQLATAPAPQPPASRGTFSQQPVQRVGRGTR